MDPADKDEFAPDAVFRTTDPAAAEDAVASRYQLDTRLILPSRDQTQFHMQQSEIQMASSAMGLLSFGTETRVVTGSTSGFHINLTLRGQAAGAGNGAKTQVADPGEGLVYEPGAVTDATWFRGSRVLTVLLAQQVVEHQLESLLGHSLRAPLRPDAQAKTDGLTQALAPVVRLARNQLDHPTPPSVLVQRHIEALAASTILLAHRHNYSDELNRPRPALPRSPIERAANLLEQRPEHHWTTATLAHAVHLSARAMQDGFKRHYSTPPMAYLRRVRLRGAHAALTAAWPGETTVQEIALRHGILHLGRFSVTYRQEYGESPSTTLARPGA